MLKVYTSEWRQRGGLDIVTLNCCEGAAGDAAPFTHSFARTLVESGVPAVVGMRERISVDDAAKVCEAFYTEVFNDIRGAATQFDTHGAAAPAEIRVTMEWVKSLAPARRTLYPGVDPGNSKQWTLPVLYSRVQPFVMVRMPTAAPAPGAAIVSDGSKATRSDNSEIEKILATLSVLRDFRDQNVSSLPTAALATLENKINLLESQLAQKPLV
jgi:hypothetical protein